MKSIYWRPQKVSSKALLAVAGTAICGLVCVEQLRLTRCQAHFDVKLAAARAARDGMDIIKQERLDRGLRIDPRFDPNQTGLIGLAMTPVTTLPAALRAKQTSVNPNFAAVIVELLTEAGVQPGDFVAVGYSGSYPALDLCTCAALETLKLRPIIISSAGSSQFGANDPELLWIDMERILRERGRISFRSIAASMGGYGDRGRGMSDETRKLLVAGIERNGLRLIQPKSLADSIDQRMQIYQEHAEQMPIRAYVNVGGGAASIRGSAGKKLYGPGLCLEAPPTALDFDSVATRFVMAGTPLINLVGVNELAKRHGFPQVLATVPAVGTGDVFRERTYNRWLTGCVLGTILLTLRIVVRTNLGHIMRQFFGWRHCALDPSITTAKPKLTMMV